MMTELVYLDDPYRFELETAVRAAGPAPGELLLAATVAYPGGGGQPADLATLRTEGRELPLLPVRKEGDEIVYRVEGGAPAPGASVVVAVDRARRLGLMRTHSALHVLCGLLWRDRGAVVTGGNMEPLKARMDFELEGFDRAWIPEIEEAVNREVAAGRPILVRYLEPGAALEGLIRTKENLVPEGVARVRVVEIEGLDAQADGGTHVRSTAEIGRVRIVGFENKGRINKRLKLELD